MKILYSCHGISVKLFSELDQQLKKNKIVSSSAYIVSNRSFYEKKFIKKNLQFEIQNSILKEWEIFQNYSKKKFEFDLEYLKNIENNFTNNVNLFDAIVADRRIFCGKKSSFFQDYSRRYSDDQMYSILINYYKSIDKFIGKFKPEILLNFLPVNLFDVLAYIICKQKNIRVLSLRSCKIKNNIYFSKSFFDPAPELINEYKKLLNHNSDHKIAIKFLEEFNKKKNNIYEGAIKPSNNPALKIKFINYINFFKNLFFNLKNNFLSDDPQSIDIFKGYFYNGFYNKLNAKLSYLVLRRSFEETKKIIKEKKFKLCFFPLHTEPEVSLLSYSKPYINQIEIIRQIALSLPIDSVLLVKEHPWSVGKRKLSYYRKILNIPRVHFVPHSFSSRYCVDISDLVFTLSSSIGQDAVFLKKPVLTFGKMNINLLPKNMVLQVSNLVDLNKQIVELVNNYKFLKKEVINYIQANFNIAAEVDLYTTLLEKSNAVNFDENKFKKNVNILSKYLIKRMNNE